MRILQVAPRYYPALGGAERHVQSLSEELVRFGHRVVVVTMTHNKNLPRFEVINGVKVLRLPAVGPAAYRIPIGLIRYLVQHKESFDVVHAHNYHAPPLLLTVAACRGRTVISPFFHGRGHTFMAKALHMIYDPLAISILRWAGAAICLSAGEAERVTTELGIAEERIAVIPSGLWLAGASSLSSAKRRDFLTLSVGRLEHYKRIDRVIKALPHLPDEYTLVIIGVGRARKRLEQYSKQLGISERVHFLGRVSNSELWNLYSRARVVVSLSEAESFGITVLESLAFDCHTVCSDIPAFRDFSEEFPQMVTIVSSEANDREVAAILKAAAERRLRKPDLQRFNWQEIANRHLEAYSFIAARKNRECFEAARQSN